MPELPEMEHYRRELIPLVTGKTITDVRIEREKTINVAPDTFRRLLVGQTITTVERRAKHLLFPLANGYTLHLHLMLGGFLFYGSDDQKLDRTAQVDFCFSDGSRLYFHGLRLGFLHIHPHEELLQELAKLAPDPFDTEMKPGVFGVKLHQKRGTLKTVLVDQSAVVSGIGNCYSDEICFAAKVLPTRRANGLQPEELVKLYLAMALILRAATEEGGYMDVPLFAGDKVTGGYDDKCAVYDRGGEPCVICGEPIVFEEVNSRKCFYCPNCQR